MTADARRVAAATLAVALLAGAPAAAQEPAAALEPAGVLLAGARAVTPAAAQEPAGDISAEQLRELAGRAASDPAALERLRGVQRVDGRPMDPGRALAGAQGAELAARLAALDPGRARSPVEPSTAAAARQDARRILEGRRYGPSPVPRPFRGVLRRLGQWLRPVTGPLGRLWSALADNTALALVAGLAVLAASSVVTARLVRRRTVAGLRRGRVRDAADRRDDPDELDRLADGAEAAGELAWAVRLRFRAGLLRLHLAGAIVDRPALTTGELTRHLPLPHLPALTAAFEEVAYGGRPATADDVEAARSNWPRVLEEAGRR